MGKTITQEIAAIVDAQGGSIEGYPTTIAGTLDALADTLAGSDVETGRSIADSVRAVGEHIGGGGGGSTEDAEFWVVCMSDLEYTQMTNRLHIEQNGVALPLTKREIEDAPVGVYSGKTGAFSIAGIGSYRLAPANDSIELTGYDSAEAYVDGSARMSYFYDDTTPKTAIEIPFSTPCMVINYSDISVTE